MGDRDDQKDPGLPQWDDEARQPKSESFITTAEQIRRRDPKPRRVRVEVTNGRQVIVWSN